MLYVKPHIRLRTTIMANELTQPESAGVPAWMRAASTGASIGNIDSSDLKPPQLKLLAGQSPEVVNGVPGASPGNFWMTVLNQPMGKEVTGSFILQRKTYNVWAPRGGFPSDVKGPLATASNGMTWDVPNQTFEIRHYGNPKTYAWKLGRLVSDFNATSFGTQNPDDPRSRPIATLTYNMLWQVDLPNGRPQLCVLIASRTMATPTKNFFTALRSQGVDHYFQRYRLVPKKETGPTGDPYFVFDYQFIGLELDQAKAEHLKDLHTQYEKSGFLADAPSDDAPARPAPAAEVHVASDEIDSIPF